MVNFSDKENAHPTERETDHQNTASSNIRFDGIQRLPILILAEHHLFSSSHTFTLTSCTHTQPFTMSVEFVLKPAYTFVRTFCLALLIEIAHTPSSFVLYI